MPTLWNDIPPEVSPAHPLPDQKQMIQQESVNLIVPSPIGPQSSG